MAMPSALHRLVNLPLVRRALTDNRAFARAYFELKFLRDNPFRPPPAYKREKIDTALSLVQSLRFASALEVGCGEGRVTDRLAAIADEVVATDIAWNAIRKARRRHRGRAGLTFLVADLLRGELGRPSFDLIFCSDVLYYFRREQLPRVNARLVELLPPGGRLLLVHERAISDDGVGMAQKEFGARTVHDALAARPELTLEADEAHRTFRATLLRRTDAT